MLKSFQNCERSATTLARIRSKASIGVPSGLAPVLSINGGIAPISTALATRSVPCRPM
jgi:hypothetical protein